MPQDSTTVDSDGSHEDHDSTAVDSDSSQDDQDQEDQIKNHITVHWFRHGLRLHDNPSLLAGMKKSSVLYPVFIFDGTVAGTKTAGYNRMRFLIECLKDMDDKLKEVGGRLYCFTGQPVDIFEKIVEEWGVTQVTFESDPEPIWKDRDNSVKNLLQSKGVQVVIEVNGGSPPLTFALFNLVTTTIGDPPRPVDDPDFSKVRIPLVDNHAEKFGVPTLEKLGIEPEFPEQNSRINKWKGGETKALELMEVRMKSEEKAFIAGYVMPNQYQPDLTGPPLSMSAHLRFGCLSVRKFYWRIYDKFRKIYPDASVPISLTAQLVWREYFYTMSVDNINYDRVMENPICLKIPWYNNPEAVNKWTMGQTGYPWIDAIMNQLRQEGWIHHVCRHAVSCFLTRGDLWISWTEGLKVFLKYLLDADWSVCAGNWMWVSSSAFEKVLQCPHCFCPVRYGKRMDPDGEFVRRYIPVLRNMPLRYLFEPWKAPKPVQEKANCIIGKDYPLPMVDHKKASAEYTPHCAPSNENEVRQFVWLPDHSPKGGKCTATFLCDAMEGL
ncbi:hypothetical protein FSP39_010528 [Pinctada imbricata]|uniref:Cryptochrome-1 n=1 Tax=Pinctada imbricata TaxID=66713 RepID=A0AA89BWT0_PINIB|nr:hypothetical protein FSP39_010528 [Pinctada imbricata]